MISNDSDHPVHPPSTGWVLFYPSLDCLGAVEGICDQRILYLGCANEQADPSLRWSDVLLYLLSWDLTTDQRLWVILCRLPEKGRKKIEDIVEEMKEREREERETGMKVKKQKK